MMDAVSDQSWMPFNGKYYKINMDYRSWQQARQHCQNVAPAGSDLVIIDNEEEQTFLNGKLDNLFASQIFSLSPP